MQITTFLTFNDQAEEAIEFYASIFEKSKIVSVTRRGGTATEAGAPLLSATFELCGQQFMALNGGPSFTFAQGMSLFVSCETQDEVDYLWERLAEGGKHGPCGWLTDKFGVSWQVVPRILGELLSDDDPEKVERVMNAMLKMSKIEIDGLREAYFCRLTTRDVSSKLKKAHRTHALAQRAGEPYPRMVAGQVIGRSDADDRALDLFRELCSRVPDAERRSRTVGVSRELDAAWRRELALPLLRAHRRALERALRSAVPSRSAQVERLGP